MDKRHFTVVIGSKEHGLYISSKPSSAAKKAVSKLCASNKSKKVEFSLREITQGSKKKTYGPYLGEMKKLKKPIELKGRVIRYEIKLHLKNGKRSTTKPAKKMRGGENGETISVILQRISEFQTQLSNLTEFNKYQVILDAIFEGHGLFNDLLRNTDYSFLKRIINYILGNKINDNKYLMIVCRIFIEINENEILIDLISRIGLDKLIEIVYESNLADFSRIIIEKFHPSANNPSGISRFDQLYLDYIKRVIFMKLIEYYSEKISLDEFKEVLKKLFSINDLSFIKDLSFIEEFFKFFKSIDGFKLFDFLLENKEQFRNFIQVLKPYIPILFFPSRIRNKIGSEQTQVELFRNV
jgi:hypothetical protein